MRVVLDTNVIISGLNFPGNERLILELALRGRFELCLSPFILEEVAGVLDRSSTGARNARPTLSGCWGMPPPSLNPAGSRRSLRAATPTTVSWSALWRLPPTTW